MRPFSVPMSPLILKDVKRHPGKIEEVLPSGLITATVIVLVPFAAPVAAILQFFWAKAIR